MGKEHVELICSIGELAGLFEKAASLEDFLQTAVSIVAYHMRAAVCSVYLYDDDKQELVLTANQGLNPYSIGRLKLKLGEGLVGMALKELRPIREGSAQRSIGYKFIPELDEERYQAFLAVPILRGLTRVGVLVVQDPVPDYFDQNDTRALQAIAAQLATVVENAKLLMALHRMEEPATEAAPNAALDAELKFLRGMPVSSGIAIGRATVFDNQDDEFHAEAMPDSEAHTRADFDRALDNTELQLEALQRTMDERLADVASMIFSAHILILKDSMFSGAMQRFIDQGWPPRQAIREVVNDYVHRFAASDNPRLREKVQDVKDLGYRLLRNLRRNEQNAADYKGRLIIAGELLPSDILKLSAQRAEGLIMISGGASSHISILARSLQFPMVIVEKRELLALPESVDVLIDGDQGTIYTDPNEEVRARFRQLQQTSNEVNELPVPEHEVARTLDGESVLLLANINMLSEIKLALRFRAAGVGLYRSEFPFIVRNDFPSEEEQFRIYRTLLDRMAGRDVVFRTLDVGGDKMLSYFPNVNEANPFLGLRAIRFSLKNKDIFSRQLRALLRAGEGFNLNIMFPLISSVDDFQAARAVVQDCQRQLQAEQTPHNPAPRLGAMVELPSAVEVAPELVAEADFISIGGNDLVQYVLAVDRTNQAISDLYLSYHPAILRSLKRIANAALAAGKPVSFCGEMASDPKILPFLLGIGIRRLSLEPRQIPRVYQQVTSLRVSDAHKEADHLLTLGRICDIEAALGIEHPPHL